MSGQVCPVCKESIIPSPRYPSYVCNDCLDNGVEVNGSIVPVSTLDVYTNSRVLCSVKGIPCFAEEAYFGGIVVQVI